MDKPFTVGIVTVSDSSFSNNELDKSGPLIGEMISSSPGYKVVKKTIVPDEPAEITKVVKHWSDDLALEVVLLTGGTGFAERDQTPETVQPLLTRVTPGITQLLMNVSLTKTPMAALSRMTSGFRNRTLIVTLPGSPKACRENLEALLPILSHALDLVRNQRTRVQVTHAALASSHLPPGVTVHQCVHQHHHIPKHLGKTNDLNAPVTKRARQSPYPMISVDEAKQIIYKCTRSITSETMEVAQDLVGRVLDEDVFAKEPVPGYRASMVDGYAVIASDGPGIYPVTQVSVASGQDQTPTLQSGQIARVTTGGLVPEGADAVVMVEDTTLATVTEDGKEEATVQIHAENVCAGSNIRPIGSDCQKGDLVCTKGTIISTLGSELGLLASVGVTHVDVVGKPKVGVFSSGNELRELHAAQPLRIGEIRDSNRMTLMAAITQAGFEAVDFGILSDDVNHIRAAFQLALTKVDVIISTGGVSMGEADWIKPMLEQSLQATIHFGRVMMKPAKPTTFATIPRAHSDPCLAFALPGNPVSATVAFYLFVLPALRRMSGVIQYENTTLPVTIKHDIQLDSRPEYHRVQVQVQADGKLVATSTGSQQSSRMLSMSLANGLLVLPPSRPDKHVVLKGEQVQCMMVGSFQI
ncbi:hypothetical protein DM01DRAFT_1035725 [Hesseltinella vesiculosa]|uniref:MoaB/Mog domain-containing protein n=1 Tax=Hesseltinella vesiculosa TaxID=101127 RepID=A0A1X2GI61_9FUNG|nr:hypothetical protein DM01DRAFT_1035725 [Hesseltinella vesiculosa]